MKSEITPQNSRYVPLTQQKYCCVPTCIQMVMQKNSILAVSAEEIGHHLGLVVPPSESKLFFNVRTSPEEPPAGYGTRIYLPEFQPNTAFKSLNIPLQLEIVYVSEVITSKQMVEELQRIETNKGDALLCFNQGVLADNDDKDWGHVCVFDRIIKEKIRIIDPSPEASKWRLIEPDKMYKAMVQHGDDNSAGIWKLDKIANT